MITKSGFTLDNVNEYEFREVVNTPGKIGIHRVSIVRRCGVVDIFVTWSSFKLNADYDIRINLVGKLVSYTCKQDRPTEASAIETWDAEMLEVVKRVLTPLQSYLEPVWAVAFFNNAGDQVSTSFIELF